jgi:uncharacterized membrane protein YgcG
MNILLGLLAVFVLACVAAILISRRAKEDAEEQEYQRRAATARRMAESQDAVRDAAYQTSTGRVSRNRTTKPVGGNPQGSAPSRRRDTATGGGEYATSTYDPSYMTPIHAAPAYESPAYEVPSYAPKHTHADHHGGHAPSGGYGHSHGSHHDSGGYDAGSSDSGCGGGDGGGGGGGD